MLTNSCSCSNLLSSLNPVRNFKHGITNTFGVFSIMKMGTAIEHFFSNRKLGVSANKLKHYIRYERGNKNKVGNSITCDNVKSVFRYVMF